MEDEHSDFVPDKKWTRKRLVVWLVLMALVLWLVILIGIGGYPAPP